MRKAVHLPNTTTYYLHKLEKKVKNADSSETHILKSVNKQLLLSF